jgi:polyisoprenoid-binding protein YceI
MRTGIEARVYRANVKIGGGMKRTTTIGLGSLVLCAVLQAANVPGGKDLEFEKGKSAVEFLATGIPSAVKIRGRTTEDQALKGKFKVQENKVSGTVKVALATLDTGIELRNKHMKEKYLEVEKFPVAEFTMNKFELPATFSAKEAKADSLPFEGELLLHGVKKNVTGTVKAEKSAEKMNLQFQFNVKMTDFGIQVPNFLGIKVAEEVQVSVQANPVLVE